MNETVKAISEYGILIVIAGTFLFLVYRGFSAWLAQINCLKESHERAVQGFIETANEFNQTVLNHMIHEEEAHREMVMVLKQLCDVQTRGTTVVYKREGTD